MNTEKIRIQCFQGFETAFDGAVFVYQKTMNLTHFFLLKIETMALHLTRSKNLLSAGKNTVIKTLLFLPGGIVKLMKVVYYFLICKYQS